MQVSNVIYTRYFTNLGGLQKPKELTYSLVAHTDVPDQYGISVAQSNGARTCVKTINQVASNRSLADNLLLFLYENAITPDVLPDVLHDLKAQGAF